MSRPSQSVFINDSIKYSDDFVERIFPGYKDITEDDVKIFVRGYAKDKIKSNFKEYVSDSKYRQYNQYYAKQAVKITVRSVTTASRLIPIVGQIQLGIDLILFSNLFGISTAIGNALNIERPMSLIDIPLNYLLDDNNGNEQSILDTPSFENSYQDAHRHDKKIDLDISSDMDPFETISEPTINEFDTSFYDPLEDTGGFFPGKYYHATILSGNLNIPITDSRNISGSITSMNDQILEAHKKVQASGGTSGGQVDQVIFDFIENSATARDSKGNVTSFNYANPNFATGGGFTSGTSSTKQRSTAEKVADLKRNRSKYTASFSAVFGITPKYFYGGFSSQRFNVRVDRNDPRFIFNKIPMNTTLVQSTISEMGLDPYSFAYRTGKLLDKYVPRKSAPVTSRTGGVYSYGRATPEIIEYSFRTPKNYFEMVILAYREALRIKEQIIVDLMNQSGLSREQVTYMQQSAQGNKDLSGVILHKKLASIAM